ncbi:hypothetical protein BHM03_00012675 [Ensete ventricosum]|nr:hypothetical protein BHM03_00012675 [Ensete ventricosum]
MEDKLRALFVEFKLGRSLSPMRSQHGESSDRKENPPEKEEQATESSYQRMRVDFLDGKTETRWDGFRARSNTSVIIGPWRLPWFDFKVADGRILKCNQKSPQVKLVLQGQVVADFFLLPLDDYEVVLDIEWLSTIVATQRLEKVPQKESNNFLIQIQELQEMKPKEIEDMNPLPQLAKILGTFTKSSRLPPIRLLAPLVPLTLNWSKEPLADARLYCCPHPQKTEAKRIAQEMTETQIIRSCFFPATTLHPYIFVSKDKLFLKCYIPPNLP